MISDSHEERATQFCFFDPHERTAPCQWISQAEVENRVSHEASLEAASWVGFAS